MRAVDQRPTMMPLAFDCQPYWFCPRRSLQSAPGRGGLRSGAIPTPRTAASYDPLSTSAEKPFSGSIIWAGAHPYATLSCTNLAKHLLACSARQSRTSSSLRPRRTRQNTRDSARRPPRTRRPLTRSLCDTRSPASQWRHARLCARFVTLFSLGLAAVLAACGRGAAVAESQRTIDNRELNGARLVGTRVSMQFAPGRCHIVVVAEANCGNSAALAVGWKGAMRAMLDSSQNAVDLAWIVYGAADTTAATVFRSLLPSERPSTLRRAGSYDALAAEWDGLRSAPHTFLIDRSGVFRAWEPGNALLTASVIKSFCSGHRE